MLWKTDITPRNAVKALDISVGPPPAPAAAFVYPRHLASTVHEVSAS
jgi:hypothetical protein